MILWGNFLSTKQLCCHATSRYDRSQPDISITASWGKLSTSYKDKVETSPKYMYITFTWFYGVNLYHQNSYIAQCHVASPLLRFTVKWFFFNRKGKKMSPLCWVVFPHGNTSTWQKFSTLRTFTDRHCSLVLWSSLHFHICVHSQANLGFMGHYNGQT